MPPADPHLQRPLLFRLAPTPSGFLHIGNLYNFLLTDAFRQSLGGRLLLRIDDLDRTRFRPAYLQDIFRHLQALGITPDLGPSGPDDFERHWSQRHRHSLYAAALDRLKPHLYACTCSRNDWKHLGPAYPGSCRDRHHDLDGPDRHWRIHVPSHTRIQRTALDGRLQSYQAHLPEGDPVLRNRRTTIAYQIATIEDDLHFGVQAIVRGMDLLPSSGFQYWLADRLGSHRLHTDGEHADHPQTSSYAEIRCWHHPLLLDANGNKRSKSTQKQGPLDLTRRQIDDLRSQAQRDADNALRAGNPQI